MGVNLFWAWTWNVTDVYSKVSGCIATTRTALVLIFTGRYSALQTMSKSYDIFLSHSGAQKEFVEQLYTELSRKYGQYSVFFDKDSIKHGEPISSIILEYAKTCKLAVAVLSEEYLTRSKPPMLELAASYTASKNGNGVPCLLPVFLELKPEHAKSFERQLKWKSKWDEWRRNEIMSDRPEPRTNRVEPTVWREALVKLLDTRGPVYKPHENRYKSAFFAENVARVIAGKLDELSESKVSYKVDFLKNTSIMSDEIYEESSDNSQSKEITIMSEQTRQHSNENLLKQQAPWTIPPLDGKYTWTKWWRLPRAGEGIVSFTAEGSNDVHVAISTSSETRVPMYEVVIGGWRNGRSIVRRQAQGLNLSFVATVGVLNPRNANQLWVSIDKRTSIIQIGHGEPSNQDILTQYLDPYFISEAQYVSFTTWDVPIIYSNVVVTELEHILEAPPDDVDEKVQLELVMNKKWSIVPRHGQYTWARYWKLPRMGQGVLAFAVEGNTDIHLAVSARPQTLKPMYEIVIGGWNNTQSVIRRESQGQNLCVVQTGIISDTSCFWVSIDDRTKIIQLGRGVPCQNTFCRWMDPEFLSGSLYFSFTTFSTSITYSNVQVATLPK